MTTFVWLAQEISLLPLTKEGACNVTFKTATFVQMTTSATHVKETKYSAVTS